MAEPQYIFSYADYIDAPPSPPDGKYIVVYHRGEFHSWPRFGLPKVAPQIGDKACFCYAETAHDEKHLRRSLEINPRVWITVTNNSYIGENGRLVVVVRK